MNLSIAYSMFLLNLGPRYLRFGKLYNNRSIRKEEDVPHELHKKQDPVSILETYGKEVYLRLGIVGGYIVQYDCAGTFTPCCKFTTDTKTELVDVMLDARDCRLPSKLILEHALANDVAVVRSCDDYETEELSTVTESTEYVRIEYKRKMARSIICVPLVIRQKNILLYAESTKDEFVDVISSSDIFILELLTQQLIVSLENARSVLVLNCWFCHASPIILSSLRIPKTVSTDYSKI
ncbi:hypothetical protein BKA69DRAFT_672051 [Paraphysoderma sedebokerense]|nr:hypothetical protein BKA69DRAFT_672051 [Paraphysoderma sedebokerense]